MSTPPVQLMMGAEASGDALTLMGVGAAAEVFAIERFIAQKFPAPNWKLSPTPTPRCLKKTNPAKKPVSPAKLVGRAFGVDTFLGQAGGVNC